jgi:hypothetical protein
MEKNGYLPFVQNIAGKITTITNVELINNEPWYRIDLDNGRHLWYENEFDPAFRPDGPLSPEDAIRAMLDGETLLDDDGGTYWWEKGSRSFNALNLGATAILCVTDIRVLPVLRRRPEKRKRTMSREEMMAWSISEESHGWMVREEWGHWLFPKCFSFVFGTGKYQRARLLPDLSNVDPDTIQGFEVEE